MAVPYQRLLRKAGSFDYHVCIHQFDKFDKFLVYTIQLPDRLPEIAIFLLPENGTVPLDLQAVFDRCYDSGPYRRRVPYDPARMEPPFAETRLAWVKQLLAGKEEPNQAH